MTELIGGVEIQDTLSRPQRVARWIRGTTIDRNKYGFTPDEFQKVNAGTFPKMVDRIVDNLARENMSTVVSLQSKEER